MINRYTTPEMTSIWSETHKLKTWLAVQLANIDAWVTKGVISTVDQAKIKQNVRINHDRMLAIEAITKHDVVAFTRMLSESLGPEKRWIHYGLTSTDLVDTAQGCRIQESNFILEEALDNIQKILKKRAIEHQNHLTMGRTHGMAAEPTSLGLKFLLWYAEFKRHVTRFNLARQTSEVAKLSGAVGNFANGDPDVEAAVAAQLGLQVDLISTQVVQRDRHVFLLQTLAGIATTLEKIALQIRLWQQTTNGEAEEAFGTGQKGSSAMPHKRNPIGSENISGLARLIRQLANGESENNLLWYERDISHSSYERVALPDTYQALHFIILRMTKILNNLVFNTDRLTANIRTLHNVFYSQTVVLEVIRTTTVSREEIYDFCQRCAFQALREKNDFLKVLEIQGVTRYLSLAKLKKLCQPNYFLRNVPRIYKRVLK